MYPFIDTTASNKHFFVLVTMDSNNRTIKEATLESYKAKKKRSKVVQTSAYAKLAINEEHSIDKQLYDEITSDGMVTLLLEEAKTAQKINSVRKTIDELQHKIFDISDQIEATDETGGNFTPGEEDDIPTPEWTNKGTFCETTRYIREQVVKRAKFQLLSKMKVPDEDRTPPPLPDDLLEEIDNLVEYTARNNTEKLYTQAIDVDLIRQLVGPDHAKARRYQRLFTDTMYINHLIAKRKTLEVHLARLEYTAAQKKYLHRMKTVENMDAFIKTIPKYHTNRLFCRKKTCKDCKHKSNPTLATYGLQKKSSKIRNPAPKPSQRQRSPSTERPPRRQKSLSPERPTLSQRWIAPSPEFRQPSPPPREVHYQEETQYRTDYYQQENHRENSQQISEFSYQSDHQPYGRRDYPTTHDQYREDQYDPPDRRQYLEQYEPRDRRQYPDQYDPRDRHQYQDYRRDHQEYPHHEEFYGRMSSKRPRY